MRNYQGRTIWPFGLCLITLGFGAVQIVRPVRFFLHLPLPLKNGVTLTSGDFNQLTVPTETDLLYDLFS